MKSHYTITDEDGVVRVDKFLAHLHPEYSRAALAKLFVLNLIKLKGEPIQAGHKLRPGTEFEYDLTPLQAVPDVIPLPIVYEDENVIVVNKPAGIISHARGRFWQEASVASFIRDKVATQTEESRKKSIETQNSKLKTQNYLADRAGIVHRLDRATSGVMVCAKNESTLKFLQKQFSDRKVQKTYIAIVEGTPEPAEAVIDAPIGRDMKDPKKFKVHEDGKTAQTTYRVIKNGTDMSMLELQPKTGRTHQLRVHLLYINHPIIGDELYSKKPYERLLLHAKSLQITMPNGEQKLFEAPIPTEFEEVCKWI